MPRTGGPGAWSMVEEDGVWGGLSANERHDMDRPEPPKSGDLPAVGAAGGELPPTAGAAAGPGRTHDNRRCSGRCPGRGNAAGCGQGSSAAAGTPSIVRHGRRRRVGNRDRRDPPPGARMRYEHGPGVAGPVEQLANGRERPYRKHPGGRTFLGPARFGGATRLRLRDSESGMR